MLGTKLSTVGLGEEKSNCKLRADPALGTTGKRDVRWKLAEKMKLNEASLRSVFMLMGVSRKISVEGKV